jgi:hypothetical protein
MRVLLITIMTLLTVDTFLYHLDPLGVVAIHHAQATYLLLMQPHPSGYRLRAGQHRLHNYTMTITQEGYRATPDSATSDCTIAAIGDSLTMGVGVDDANTWVNLLAREIQQASWVNAGRGDYSAGNIWALLENTPADGYLWLIFSNDAITPMREIPVLIDPNANIYLPATRLYLNYVRGLSPASGGDTPNYGEQPGRPVDFEQFWRYADDILTHPHVLAFAFADNVLGVESFSRYDNVYVIPPFTARLSYADGHPSIQGHQQIAAAMLPQVKLFADSLCAP